MKLLLSTFLLLFSIQLVAQSTPATKDDIKMILREMYKRFEQTREDNRILREDMNKRFETIYWILGLMIIIFSSTIGALFVLIWRVSDKSINAITDLKISLLNQIIEQKDSKIDKYQADTKTNEAEYFIRILSNPETKLKIRELLQIS